MVVSQVTSIESHERRQVTGGHESATLFHGWCIETPER